ncbi:MAG: DUF6089 family protein [Salibacteraceae bacterium]
MAQKTAGKDWEVGLTGGICWYNGDINPDKFFNPNVYNQAFGLSVRKNLNQRFALRGHFNYGVLSGSDEVSTSEFQVNRNLNFTTPIYELASTIEFNFFEFDALLKQYQFSPYSFIGLSVFRFNPSTEVEGGVYDLQPLATEAKVYSRTSIAIPFGFGFKWALSDRAIIHADWGMRKTFTDYIDDVSTSYPAIDEIDGLSQNLSDRSLEQSGPDGTNWGTQRGNSKTKDWYNFVTAGISVRIGPKKGSCKHIGI